MVSAGALHGSHRHEIGRAWAACFAAGRMDVREFQKKKKVIQRSGRSLCFFVCREGVWTNDRKKDSRTYVAAERSKVCGRERMHPIV